MTTAMLNLNKVLSQAITSFVFHYTPFSAYLWCLYYDWKPLLNSRLLLYFYFLIIK